MKLKVKDITLIAMMAAVIEVSKLVLAQIPNVELTTFWIMMFSLYFGKRVYYVIIIFILLEGIVYGPQLWWIMYLYTWPLLAYVTMRLKDTSTFNMSIVSCVFGLLFGFLCSFPYFFIGLPSGIAEGFRTAFTWWIAGIPWDMVHGIANFLVMFILHKPIKNVMDRYKYISG